MASTSERAGLVLSDSFLSLFLQRFITVLEHVTFPTKNYQPLCHTVLALNRFTVFAFPAKHSRIWTRRTVLAFIATIAAVSLLLGGFPSVYFGVEYAYFIPPEQEVDHMGWEVDAVGFTIIRKVELVDEASLVSGVPTKGQTYYAKFNAKS